MMRVFVSGATGFLGGQLALRLAEAGHEVHALCRSKEKAEAIRHQHIKVFYGDLLDIDSLRTGMESCEQVYHLGAVAGVWLRRNQRYREVNVNGTRHILDLAMVLGIRKVVVTSTAGVFGPSAGSTLNETSVRSVGLFTEYERSKASMEQLVKTFVRRGLHVVIVNPSRVYGPGVLARNNATNKLIGWYLRGRWRIVPGDGKTIGNYAFVDDVINGHIRAMEKGRSGEQYILGGVNLTARGLLDALAEVIGKKRWLVGVPFPMLRCMGLCFLSIAKLTGGVPLFTPDWIEKYAHDSALSCVKAEAELDYRITSLSEALQLTIEWLLQESVK